MGDASLSAKLDATIYEMNDVAILHRMGYDSESAQFKKPSNCLPTTSYMPLAVNANVSVAARCAFSIEQKDIAGVSPFQR